MAEAEKQEELKAQDKYLEMQDELNELKSKYDNLVSESAVKDARIVELQEMNQKLFLRVSTDLQDTPSAPSSDEQRAEMLKDFNIKKRYK